MINTTLRIEKGYQSFVTVDVMKTNNPNSDIELTKKLSNILIHKLPFIKVRQDYKTLFRKEQLNGNEYDHIINMIRSVDHTEKKLNLNSYLRKGVIVKNRIRIYFEPSENISSELKEFLDTRSTLNFVGWFAKFEHVYNFEFKEDTSFYTFLKQLQKLDVSEFTTQKLMQHTFKM